MTSGEHHGPARWRRPGRWSAAAATLVVVAAAAYWAGHQTWGASADEPADVDHVVQEVRETSVGRTLSLNVTVEQPFVPVATNAIAGTVTSVAANEQVETGDVLYAADTVPVRAVVGEVPFWRDLSSGDDGADVQQLQQALAELGFFTGEPDGRFGWSTSQAVRQWQADLDIEVDGTVRLGELVAVPELPAQLQLADEVFTGAQLSGGEEVVSAASGEIDFQLVVSEGQAELIPPDATVTVEHDGHEWEAVLGESGGGDGGNVQYALSAPDGGLVCADECGELPAQERTSLAAEVGVVPEVSGPAVPTAAVHSDPDGTTWVRLADGGRREVIVRGSAGGVAVVDGIEEGERVQVLGGADGGPQGSAAEHGGGVGARR